MKITILCSDQTHPVNQYLDYWVAGISQEHKVDVVRRPNCLTHGDVLFLVSCSSMISGNERSRYTHTLVLHASDLPRGRGWSPHVWDIINGAEHITLSLIDAEDRVDTGRIWLQEKIPVAKHMLWDEVNHLLFETEIQLMNRVLNNLATIEPLPQSSEVDPTYYKKRTPNDSQLSVEKTIEQQFDLMRICDPERYPAWFEMHGQRYKITLEKFQDE